MDKVLQLQADGYKVECLLGNHEWLLLNAPYDDGRLINWLSRNGGAITLQSYGIQEDDFLSALPTDHAKFYRNLQYIIELEDYILVHAGLNFAMRIRSAIIQPCCGYVTGRKAWTPR